jgi:predicted transcriptional regulator
MLKYRSREVIAAIILRLIKENNGISRTKIMHYSLLSHTQLLYYLNFLLKYNLIEHNRSMKVYTITSKGLQVIELYDKMISMLEGSDLLTVNAIKGK